MKAHLYLRASTKEQDARRAEDTLRAFAEEHSLEVQNAFVENASGTKLDRPELINMLAEAERGDAIVVESVDRLSRLSQQDWGTLKRNIEDKGLRLVVQDLPTSHQTMEGGITGDILRVINSMLIDLMATMARLDQEKRVERIQQGIARKKAKEPDWKPAGRAKDRAVREKVLKHLRTDGLSNEDIANIAGCGVATVYRIKKELKQSEK
ncbi:recombinase family protein [Kushneria sp. TE3]|uniref:recombinase family protein n=1 Tax=Kushneria sp. TE3 TaxID=3449832 RepID=UPI003F685A95